MCSKISELFPKFNKSRAIYMPEITGINVCVAGTYLLKKIRKSFHSLAAYLAYLIFSLLMESRRCHSSGYLAPGSNAT